MMLSKSLCFLFIVDIDDLKERGKLIQVFLVDIFESLFPTTLKYASVADCQIKYSD